MINSLLSIATYQSTRGTKAKNYGTWAVDAPKIIPTAKHYAKLLTVLSVITWEGYKCIYMGELDDRKLSSRKPTNPSTYMERFALSVTAWPRI